ncbi:hypothetical protein BDF20DRAFT_914088 [Mycotypha africana]|uniref:uncharacterized protein n=1 Tax=Mycotypha africana TaxID=64632 RepID=UPI0022FFE456|nr:uncharacterized protein BDF20DRAFT_914088 [Mycotypha africana]KAI8975113.1 hypothetical protein BDF20DRAFT_914088 [Mycotypha africana]
MRPTFSSDQLYRDLSELDQLLFAKNQQSIKQELETFVDHFENSGDLVTTDELARSLVHLTNCESKLAVVKSDKVSIATASIQEKLQQAQTTLDELLTRIKQANVKDHPTALEKERERYLTEKEERLRQAEKDFRKDMDLLDERYAKKMRDSIYQNLVGFRHQ